MPRNQSDAPEELTPSQRARLRTRDRKRSTAMVVDNAGVKRTALALAQRRVAQAGSPEQDATHPD
ncbi:MAG: hypothetical protein JF887_08195 [Candidatus Dormibacteraeota bacterium]|uniref:Uncharacterized protein n=1 Tax=Candidatus Amunia macphersoniae TaxID=3127014 RepID=A0A934NGK8_9BACT|nr:hypothetical protein [Candidatus Dormibacteraeota bacterium]